MDGKLGKFNIVFILDISLDHNTIQIRRRMRKFHLHAVYFKNANDRIYVRNKDSEIHAVLGNDKQIVVASCANNYPSSLNWRNECAVEGNFTSQEEFIALSVTKFLRGQWIITGYGSSLHHNFHSRKGLLNFLHWTGSSSQFPNFSSWMFICVEMTKRH